MKTRKQLADEYVAKQAAVKAIVDKGLDNLTKAEADALEALFNERDAIKAEIDAFPKADAVKGRVDAGVDLLTLPASATSYPAPGDAAAAVKAKQGDYTTVGEPEVTKFLRKGPFKSFGHLCYEVKRCGDARPGFVRDGALGEWNGGVGKYDDCIKAMPLDVKAASGLNEVSDAEGATMIPVEFAAGIWNRTAGEDNLLTRIGATPVAGNGLKIKAWNDKSRSGDVLFGGARAYWGAEASQFSKSAPTFRDIDLKLNKLYVLMYATEELLADAPALESELTKVAGACFVYKINRSLIRGGGVGEPLGFLNAQAKVTVAKEAGQLANTIQAANVDKMWARRSPGSAKNMVWLYTIDAEQQLGALSYSTGSASGQLVNMPPQGLAGLPNQVLKGREMVESEHCSGLTTEGDLILWDPTQHVAIVKSTGVDQSVSMHLRFDYDEVAYKFTFRMDARSRWEDAMTPAQSTNTRSPIITLQTR